MKEDSIEQFVKSHRAEFDDRKAPLDLWPEIEKELPPPTDKTNNSWKNLALLLGALLIVALLYISISVVGLKDVEESQADFQFAELPEFIETEEYYLSAIYAAQNELMERHVDATLDQDLSLLDTNADKLRIEYMMAQGIHKEQVLRALILNYKTKLQILQHVLTNIEKSESNEKIY